MKKHTWFEETIKCKGHGMDVSVRKRDGAITIHQTATMMPNVIIPEEDCLALEFALRAIREAKP